MMLKCTFTLTAFVQIKTLYFDSVNKANGLQNPSLNKVNEVDKCLSKYTEKQRKTVIRQVKSLFYC